MQVRSYHILEFIINAYILKIGLNCCVFNQLNKEYNNFIILLQQLGFKYLDLALIANKQDRNGQQ